MSMTDACLLVDNSNTRTKFALRGCGGKFEVRVLPTADISASAVQGLLRGWEFTRVCLCSVVPRTAALIRQILSGYPFLLVGPDACPDVDFSTYPGVETLGADRVANVLAAVAQLPLPLVAVDLGTAATFDVVTGGENAPVFRGGAIAPGYAAVASALCSRTALLPDCPESASCRIIAQNTHEAMCSAVRVGYPGMVDAILDAVESELGESVNVVLTGGDAAAIAPLMRRKCRIEPALTLQGIALAAGLRV